MKYIVCVGRTDAPAEFTLHTLEGPFTRREYKKVIKLCWSVLEGYAGAYADVYRVDRHNTPLALWIELVPFRGVWSEVLVAVAVNGRMVRTIVLGE